jgi:hypothetical protein
MSDQRYWLALLDFLMLRFFIVNKASLRCEN